MPTKEKFDKVFILKTIFELLIIGGGVWAIEYFFETKYAPIVAAETLKRENFLNAKKQAYFEAIEVANKVIANTDFDSVDALTGKVLAAKFLHKHTVSLSSFELEINDAYSKLMVFASDTNIISSFYRIFVTPPGEKHIPIVAMQKFVTAIRKDLGNDEDLPDNYQMLFIVMPSKEDSVE